MIDIDKILDDGEGDDPDTMVMDGKLYTPAGVFHQETESERADRLHEAKFLLIPMSNPERSAMIREHNAQIDAVRKNRVVFDGIWWVRDQ